MTAGSPAGGSATSRDSPMVLRRSRSCSRLLNLVTCRKVCSTSVQAPPTTPTATNR